MVLQSCHVFAHRSVLDNVTPDPIKVRGPATDAAPARALELLTRVGVVDQTNKLPARLSTVSSSASRSPARWPWNPN
jgi:ABC-type polar amino acid transport system ATPase subunit